MPKISVIIPTYNTERFVEQAIRSVMYQTERDIEVIVVDDGSSDGSMELINKLAEDDTRIRVLKNTRQKGVSGARNTGLLAADGEWIGFLDSDDIMTHDSLDMRMGALQNYPNCSWVGGDFAMISETGSSVVAEWFVSKDNIMQALQDFVGPNGLYFIRDPVKLFLDQTVIIWTGTVLIHRSLVEKVGLFNETMSHGEDIDYWYRLGAYGDFLFVPKVVANYRQRSGSASKALDKLVKGNLVLYRGLMQNKTLIKYKAELSDKHFTSLVSAIRYYREQGAFATAAQFALRAIGFKPTSILAWKQMLACMARRI